MEGDQKPDQADGLQFSVRTPSHRPVRSDPKLAPRRPRPTSTTSMRASLVTGVTSPLSSASAKAELLRRASALCRSVRARVRARSRACAWLVLCRRFPFVCFYPHRKTFGFVRTRRSAALSHQDDAMTLQGLPTAQHRRRVNGCELCRRGRCRICVVSLSG